MKNPVFFCHFILLIFISCHAPVNPPPILAGPTEQPIPLDTVENIDLHAIPKGYSYILDTSALDGFIYNWYRLAYSYDYHFFQKEAVLFPFQSFLQDSLGNSYSITFPGLDSMFAWRKNHATFFKRSSLDFKRVVYEGYPEFTFDSMSSGHFDHIAQTDSIIVTYITPCSKADYYFQRTNGRWLLLKSAHRQYALSELKKKPERMFEDFLLRFISDATFQIQHVKFPLKHQRRWVEGKTESSYISKEQWNVWDSQCHMTIYPNFEKKRQEPRQMYLSIRDEGGGGISNCFQKMANTWMLVETFNGSN